MGCICITYKVLSIISGPVGMIHPAIGGALGIGINLSGALDKRGNSSSGMISNEDAESGTVWMYDQNWYICGDVVPYQVTPATDIQPKVSIVGGAVGTNIEYSYGNHVQSLNVTTSIPPRDSASGSVGENHSNARNDHQHPPN
ncbi:MAG: hypothetical protein EZS28_039543, partial [Streblomastix strix]